MIDIVKYLESKPYPGRGILLGATPSGKPVAAYFIMGRSENSRNRVFVRTEDGIRTQAHDPAKMTDPSLIIYHPVRKAGDALVVTNGDQTDTIRDFHAQGRHYTEALMSREFEPDAPNYTPRISGVMESGGYMLSILKSADGNPGSCQRFFYTYDKPIPGAGHFISTYAGGGSPVPSFSGEPLCVALADEGAEVLARKLWAGLNGENKVSLYVNIGGEVAIINKNKRIHTHQDGAHPPEPGSESAAPPQDAQMEIFMTAFGLKYGCNPNQTPAKIFMKSGSALPIEVENGRPGYINFMDALNSWQLVKELKEATGLPSAASFKHVSPAGAAVGLPLSDILKKVYFAPEGPLSPLACAYARARGADRLCSYGDWAALSDTCDADTARLLSVEVSDGVIAPGYTREALAILKAKRKGGYNVVRIHPDYIPAAIEHRDIFGVTFEQGRNSVRLDEGLFKNIVTAKKALSAEAKRDLLISMITLKYTQSNSVCYAKDGQAIGVGAGQQSRVHCVRLAGSKADNWYLRQHPAVLALPWREDVSRPGRDNAIDVFISDDPSPVLNGWEGLFTEKPQALTPAQKRAWLDAMTGVALGSDAFFPFSDNIERANMSGVSYIAQPGGSIRDDAVIGACDKYGMVMAFTGLRLFHH